MALLNATFTDLYLSLNGKEGWFKDSLYGLKPVEEEYMEEMARLACECVVQEEQGLEEYSLKFEGARYRVSVFNSESGCYRVLRKQPVVLRKLEELGIHPGVNDQLLQPNLKGLILIAGKTGSGKTTTASAVVSARLEKFGGVCITIEDPPEMPLEGMHGQGRCFQTIARRDIGGFSEALRRTVRRSPDIIFLGELRDNDTASEALRASINGHLVIATIHAGNPIEAIERLISMSQEINREGARSLLADGLCMVISQNLEAGRLRIIPLSFVMEETAKGIQTKVRKGEVSQLSSDISAQTNLLARYQAPRRVESK